MATLNSTQRSFLEKTVVKARQLSEAGAIKALQNLAIDQPEPFTHMDTDQRTMRRRLRSKARLLGDEIVNGKQQKIDRLSYELAYEYWHKMLFAKFLEANNLLIHPIHQISVSFEDCDEFSREEDYPDKWTAAAHYASHMLPAIFRPEDPLMQVEFATEDRLALEQLLESIEEEIFIAGDSLGWVYQFWQSEEKERINKSEEKIDGEKLPAVTQLFTEPYMVHFLIDNTIGAWWVSRHPREIPPVDFEYLRLLNDGTPAAGKFEGWPDEAKDITTLDPCMGSGHFIVELFNVLAPLRMFEEGLSKEEATKKVITDNLHGLEIDPRCTQIAAFNLALTAWKFNGKYLELPELNLACSGVAPKGKKEDWIKLVGNVQPQDVKARMENGMGELYDLFQKAPELGSLLDPSIIKPDSFTVSFDQLKPILEKALYFEKSLDNDELIARGTIALGLTKVGQILNKRFIFHTTNVPFLARGKHNEIIADYLGQYFEMSKNDLATVFIERMLQNSCENGIVSLVAPQNWLFQSTYLKFRESLLKKYSINFLARLGENGFRSSSAAGAFAILISLKKRNPDKQTKFFGCDISIYNTPEEKAKNFKNVKIIFCNQNLQVTRPGKKIIISEENNIESNSFLSEYCNSYQGIKTGDDNRYKYYFWEISDLSDWKLASGGFADYNGNGSTYVLRWSFSGKDFARLQGLKAIDKRGFYLTNIRKVVVRDYFGEFYTSEITVVIPKSKEYLQLLRSFFESDDFLNNLRLIDPNLAISTSSIVQVKIDYNYWLKQSKSKYTSIALKPYTNEPTQWSFHGHPKPGENSFQVALCRLMGYQWPAEKDEEMELAEEARKYIKEIQAFNYLADEDGIVCIPSVNGEQPAAERLRDYIKEVWGGDWENNTIPNLLKQAGSKKVNLEQWLREEFFEQHIKLFHNRPFIWNIWDGRKDGFSVLVNYHKLDKANLQKFIYTYLGDWIRQCEIKLKDNESGADGLLMAATKLKDQLILILEGEPPYDIFVRWKPLEKQLIGWEPDINDGVRLNIYPFIQAGILKKKPNIKWGKDRGKNPPGTPWGADRYNRYEELAEEYKLTDDKGEIIPHLKNEIKRKARESVNA